MTIHKGCFYAYLVEREEYEAIYVVEHWDEEPKILTEVPTEAYEEYMSNKKRDYSF